MTIRLPSDGQWKTSNESDLFGHIIYAKNMDFNRSGYIALARKAMALLTSTQDANFGSVVCLAMDDTFLYVITTDGIFSIQLTSDTLTVVKLTTTNGPDGSFQRDVVFFNGKMHVSGATKVCSWDGVSAWTVVINTGLSSNYPHPLCVSEHQAYLCVGGANTNKLYDTSYSLITTLTIDAQYIITCIRWRQNTIYNGTRNIQGAEAKCFLWDGSGAAAQAGYGVGADWIYSMCEYGQVIAIITSAGQLMKYGGAGFVVLENLPVYFTPYSWSSDAAVLNLVGRVASRGMQASGDRIYLVIDGRIRQTAQQYPGVYLPEQPSGVWEYQPSTGLKHKAGFNYKQKQALVASDLNSNSISFASAHQALTGDAVLCSGVGGLTGTASGQTYYAIVQSTTVISLALTPADALAGRALTIGGNVAAGDIFEFDRYESMGETILNNAGGILVFGSRHPNIFYGSEVVFGGETFKSDGTACGTVMSLGMARNIGYAVTAKMLSSQTQDLFKSLVAFLTPMWLATDLLIVKYRIVDTFGYPTYLSTSTMPTWTGPSTFTADASVKDIRGLVNGNEIEIIQGAAAGYSAHITGISISGTIYTFTIDEVLPVTNGDRFDFIGWDWIKWKTINSISKNNFQGFADLTLGKRSVWVQFKLEFRGFARFMRAMDVVNTIGRAEG